MGPDHRHVQNLVAYFPVVPRLRDHADRLRVGLAGFPTGEIFGVHNVQFLYGNGIMALFSAVRLVVISLRNPAPDMAETGDVVVDRNTWRAESRDLVDTPWYRNYRWLALAIFVVTVAAVVPFI